MTDLQQLSSVEHAVHAAAVQRQSLQTQLDEIESAEQELGTDGAFKIIGNLMVQTSSEQLKKELGEKKISLTQRLTALQEQEKKLRAEMEKLKDEVLDD